MLRGSIRSTSPPESKPHAATHARRLSTWSSFKRASVAADLHRVLNNPRVRVMTYCFRIRFRLGEHVSIRTTDAQWTLADPAAPDEVVVLRSTPDPPVSLGD